MSSQPNEITYEKEFAGNLHGQIEPVPARVTTRLRVMTDERAREVKQYAHHHNGVLGEIEQRQRLKRDKLIGLNYVAPGGS